MKFIESEDLMHITSILSGVDVGDSVINGRIEVYSCKDSHADKVLNQQLTEQLSEVTDQTGSFNSQVDDFSGMNVESSNSCPLGDLKDPHVLRLLARLIATLNQSYPDFDFSNSSPNDFKTETIESISEIMRINLIDPLVHTGFPSFGLQLTESLKTHVDWPHCEIYSFTASIEDGDGDDGSGSLWYMNYFFYNKKVKKIVFLTCWSTGKNSNQNDVDFDLSQNSRRIFPL